jgi:ABC-type xylose transport system substrate-binding protein
MSSLPAIQLPRSMKRAGVKTVCAVESVILDSDMKLKNRHWYVTFTNREITLLTAQVQHRSAISPRGV